MVCHLRRSGLRALAAFFVEQLSQLFESVGKTVGTTVLHSREPGSVPPGDRLLCGRDGRLHAGRDKVGGGRKTTRIDLFQDKDIEHFGQKQITTLDTVQQFHSIFEPI